MFFHLIYFTINLIFYYLINSYNLINNNKFFDFGKNFEIILYLIIDNKLIIFSNVILKIKYKIFIYYQFYLIIKNMW